MAVFEWVTPTELAATEGRIQASIAELKTLIVAVISMGGTMEATITDIQTAVAAERDVTQGAITLLNNLTGLIKSNINDPVQLQSILDDVNAQKQALADAISANTPAAAASA